LSLLLVAQETEIGLYGWVWPIKPGGVMWVCVRVSEPCMSCNIWKL